MSSACVPKREGKEGVLVVNGVKDPSSKHQEGSYIVPGNIHKSLNYRKRKDDLIKIDNENLKLLQKLALPKHYIHTTEMRDFYDRHRQLTRQLSRSLKPSGNDIEHIKMDYINKKISKKDIKFQTIDGQKKQKAHSANRSQKN